MLYPVSESSSSLTLGSHCLYTTRLFIHSSTDDSSLIQSLPWWLQNDRFPALEPPSTLTVGPQHSAVIKSLSFSPHFIHLFIIVISSWIPIFECFIIRSYTNYFGAQILCQLWPAGAPSTSFSWPASIVFDKGVPYFLALHDIPGSSAVYSVKPWNEPFSEMLSLHTLGMVVEIKLWVPGAHYYWGTLLLSPFSRQSWVIETCIYTYANTYIHVHVHTHVYRYTCVHNHVYTYI